MHACLVAERWLDRVQHEEGVGTHTLYKLDQHLFRRSTRNACETTMRRGEFADDVVLMASTRQTSEAVIRTYVDVTRAFGLTADCKSTEDQVHGGWAWSDGGGEDATYIG